MLRIICVLLMFFSLIHWGQADDANVKILEESKLLKSVTQEPKQFVESDVVKAENKQIDNQASLSNQAEDAKDNKVCLGKRIFKKTPSLASSVIIKVYDKEKFIGIVLIERGRAPLGKALPGGIIRYEETCEECVFRTARDECGLNVQNMKQFHVYSSSDRDPRTHMIDIVYTAQCTSFTLSAGTDAKHAYVCPINEIPWDKLVFDHAQILKDFLEAELSKDRKELKQEVASVSIANKKEHEEKDFKEISKAAYKPLALTTSVIIEFYEKGVFKGIVIIERGLEPYGKALPGGPVQYGETVGYAAQREMKEECTLDLTDMKQFRVYDAIKRDPRKRCIEVIHVARCNNIKPVAGSDAAKVWVCPLDKIPWDELAFDHAQVLRDYLIWRDGDLKNLLTNP